jgi:hypothetical protein
MLKCVPDNCHVSGLHWHHPVFDDERSYSAANNKDLEIVVAVFAHTSTPIAIEKLQLDGHAGLKRPHMNVLSVDLRLDQVELILLPPINRNLDWLGWIARRNAIYIGYSLMVGSRNAPPGLRVRTHIRTKSHGKPGC